MNPFRRSRPTAKRKMPRRVLDRVRLTGEAKIQLRRDVFTRSRARCEEIIKGERCPNKIYWSSFHLSHARHGPWKSDTLETTSASCAQCHRNRHNAGGKPIPRRPGRVMTRIEALEYLKSDKCFCEAPKRKETAFCDECKVKLSSQSQMDLERLTHREWLRAFAAAEIELLRKGIEEQHAISRQ